MLAIVWASYQGIRWASRPASADELYAQISTAAESPIAAALVDVEADMAQFMSQYADDARAVDVKQFQTRLELYRLQRRLEDKARRRRDQPASAMEDLYLEILPLIRTDPDLAAQRLQAFLDLYTASQRPG